MPGILDPYRYQFETVAVSQTGQVLGGTGATGDYLHRVIINVIAAATGDVTIIDGSTSIVISTGAATLPLGANSVECNMRSRTGPWSVTTGAGATVIGVGIFSK